MEAFWIGYSMFVGLWVALMLAASAETWRVNGKLWGVLVGLASVAAPLVGIALYSPRVALCGAVIGLCLVGVARWIQRQEENELKGKPVSRLFRVLT